MSGVGFIKLLTFFFSPWDMSVPGKPKHKKYKKELKQNMQ